MSNSEMTFEVSLNGTSALTWKLRILAVVIRALGLNHHALSLKFQGVEIDVDK
jgi:hypothetical protein